MKLLNITITAFICCHTHSILSNAASSWRYTGIACLVMVQQQSKHILHIALYVAWHCQVCLVTNPIWVIKTRLQLQRGPGPAVSPRLRQTVTHLRSNAGPYRGFVHAVRQTAKEEGFRGFYKGLLPSLLLVSMLLH